MILEEPGPNCAALVRSARSGDTAAQRVLYDRHLARVFGTCLAFAHGDRDRACDLTQDTFVAAFAALDRLSDPAAFAGWLKVITRRTCLRDAERRAADARARARLSDVPPDDPAEPEHVALALAEVALRDCPDDTLRSTALAFYGDPPRSVKEIASAQGVTVTAVTTRLYRFRIWARAFLLRRLAEET